MGKGIQSGYMLHGALVGVVGILLFQILWVFTIGSVTQPFLYVVAHFLKVLGGMTGGLVVQRRKERDFRAA